MSLSEKIEYSNAFEDKYHYEMGWFNTEDVREAVLRLKEKAYDDMDFTYGSMVLFIDEIFGPKLV